MSKIQAVKVVSLAMNHPVDREREGERDIIRHPVNMGRRARPSGFALVEVA